MELGAFIAENGTSLSREPGQHVFRQGDRNSSLYFLKSGLLKAYYLSADGKEHIKSFILPGNHIGSLMASHAEKSCSFSLVCLRQCNLTMLPFSRLYQAARSDPAISAAVVDLLLSFAMKKEAREYELLCLSAADRYRRLVENTPDLLKLVTQNEIARYLGVTPVGLSRIKKRLAG
ncbi:Crp/Fnr family transcriptional regulator [Hoeflea sp. YIM 152468]|uniref:Crp/Fnr family transcriptional regulator n=1 Tax=Hoeflea sp. YIM 152468 TaxID=3031759 RepID=UPI0023D9E105|nr:Crp/Fnr family transcriptional regulator [Hoeflea sp. YIM 152468]MDF1607832.1 Crp/Fnr family transcriptional regulator [Hoeflea sp. YIM 152468]